MSGLKTGAVANDRLGALVRKYYVNSNETVIKDTGKLNLT